jgi:hypothetical protein
MNIGKDFGIKTGIACFLKKYIEATAEDYGRLSLKLQSTGENWPSQPVDSFIGFKSI